ncbi:hypothetical protein GEV33_010773 [Tenebrio molitor]|uniref:Uncharacterized protein n=1 Tax=Tenebrio molitor TaxID=7067 RepID=A0A8J6LA97_TENMO|nr:hypothetical protein GEV33_010773 [Tenebrio molitor]
MSTTDNRQRTTKPVEQFAVVPIHNQKKIQKSAVPRHPLDRIAAEALVSAGCSQTIASLLPMHFSATDAICSFDSSTHGLVRSVEKIVNDSVAEIRSTDSVCCCVMLRMTVLKPHKRETSTDDLRQFVAVGHVCSCDLSLCTHHGNHEECPGRNVDSCALTPTHPWSVMGDGHPPPNPGNKIERDAHRIEVIGAGMQLQRLDMRRSLVTSRTSVVVSRSDNPPRLCPFLDGRGGGCAYVVSAAIDPAAENRLVGGGGNNLGSMDIKHEIYREDDMLLVKPEPQLHSPCASSSSNGLAPGATITTNLLCANTNNGLVTTLASSSSLNGLTNNVQVVPSNGLSSGPFSSIGSGVSASKRQRTDDWLSSPSPGNMSGNVPPLTPSPGPPSHPYTVISNGYSSPMSSGSYDPYSPNGKIVVELDEVRLLRYSAQLHVVNPAACDMLRILANRVNSRYLLVANYRDNFFVVKDRSRNGIVRDTVFVLFNRVGKWRNRVHPVVQHQSWLVNVDGHDSGAAQWSRAPGKLVECGGEQDKVTTCCDVTMPAPPPVCTIKEWSGLQAVRVTPEESSSEVTSSSTTLVMSPANSLASTDIGDVDLEFWDLDLNAQNHGRGLTIIQNGYGIPGHTIIASNHHLAKSDTSSMSGKHDGDPGNFNARTGDDVE